MNPKPGIWTTEHFAAIVSQVLTLLALFGFISQNDTQTLEEAVTKGIAAVFIFIANAAVVVHYIKGRLHLKAGAQVNGTTPAADTKPAGGTDSQAPKLISSGLVLLAVLTVFAGPAQAQYVLPFRNNHEQRLKQLEQKIANQQQAAPAPQQAPLSTVSRPAAVANVAHPGPAAANIADSRTAVAKLPDPGTAAASVSGSGTAQAGISGGAAHSGPTWSGACSATTCAKPGAAAGTGTAVANLPGGAPATRPTPAAPTGAQHRTGAVHAPGPRALPSLTSKPAGESSSLRGLCVHNPKAKESRSWNNSWRCTSPPHLPKPPAAPREALTTSART